MTPAVEEFIRRVLLCVLPSGFHRIRHYGPFASPKRAANIERLRDLIAGSKRTSELPPSHPQTMLSLTTPRRPPQPRSVLAAAGACAS